MAEQINSLAQEIRRVDGTHSLGAGALAEALTPWLAAHDRQVAAQALRDAAVALYADETAERGTTKAMRHAIYAAWLLGRADPLATNGADDE